MESNDYFFRKNRFNLGFEIVNGYKVVYYTPFKSQAERALESLENGNTPEAPSNTWPIRILKFEEKHGDRYFTMKTMDDFRSIAVKIVKERHSQNMYYFIPEPKVPDFPKDTIETLPDSLKKQAEQTWKQYDHHVMAFKQSEKRREILNEAISGDGNGDSAIAFLSANKHNEYENFEIITPEQYLPIHAIVK